MSRLYPSLHEKYKSEGICPICLTEMAYSPRFSCDSDHIICQRCRPYYFNCPQCLQPLHEIAPPSPENYGPRPAVRTSLHSAPPPSCPYPTPSAPHLEEFHEHERHVHWNPPPMPTVQPHLLECPYSHLGCTAKFVPALRDMHVYRCQYKHQHDNVEELTQVVGCEDSDDVRPCRYESNGCNVRLPYDRLFNHEGICIYKDREPSPPLHCQEEERIACKYESVGCTVRVPHYRLDNHEQMCIYKDREPSPPADCGDDRIPCRYQSTGCNVRLPHWQLSNHEEICIYKNREAPTVCETGDLVPCRYQSVGCHVRVPHYRLPSHESICIYKDRSSCGPESVEELSQHLEGGFHLQEDPYNMVGCRFQGLGCNSRMPAWRRQAHEAQCIYRRH